MHEEDCWEHRALGAAQGYLDGGSDAGDRLGGGAVPVKDAAGEAIGVEEDAVRGKDAGH